MRRGEKRVIIVELDYSFIDCIDDGLVTSKADLKNRTKDRDKFSENNSYASRFLKQR